MKFVDAPGVSLRAAWKLRPNPLTALAAAVVSLLFTEGAAADVMRCGEKLVSTGDTQYEVRATCGHPDAQGQRIETRLVQRRVPIRCPLGSQQRYCEIIVSETLEVVIDEWVYDFGRNRFIEHAIFEQGRLLRVETRGYGKKDPV